LNDTNIKEVALSPIGEELAILYFSEKIQVFRQGILIA
jgi:hypothetical protein